MNYTANYRRNLTEYWQQFYPNWKIPAGYHVHHIKPKCTFEDKHDPRIDHPSNLVALHPDDHVSIHRNRGDKFVSEYFIWHIAGKKWTDESKKKMSKTTKGKKLTEEHKQHISKASLGKKGTRNGATLSAETKAKMSAAAKGRVNSKESKLKQSKSCKGRIPWNKGKSMSTEYKKNCSDRMKGKNRGPYNIKKKANEY